MADTSANPPPGLCYRDPLAKVQPHVTMCQDNFKLTYKPGQNILIDKSTLAYKDQVKFLQYSKNKPNRFHIKLFMVSEPDTGYICGFSVYTGRTSNKLLVDKSTVDPDCTVTTKTVMGLLQKCNLLHSHRTLYFNDNWFNSPELLHGLRYVKIKPYSFLHIKTEAKYFLTLNFNLTLPSTIHTHFRYRDTYGAGTIRKNRCGLSKAVTKKTIKMKKGEAVFRCKDYLLCLKVFDRRPVTMLSS